MTTAMPGYNAELQRDLPGLVSFYTPHGMPILTRQTQNHSLTSTIPYAIVDPQISEPTAARSGPDAIITLGNDLRDENTAVADPLHQGISVSTKHQRLSAGAVAEHTAPGPLEHLIKELEAYSTIWSGYAAAKYRRQNTSAQVHGQHTSSQGEFGKLFDLDSFQETDRVSTAFAHLEHCLDKLCIEAGYGLQRGRSERLIEKDLGRQPDDIWRERRSERLRADSYQAGIRRNETRLSAQYHDITHTIQDTTARLGDLQLLAAHEQHILPETIIRLQARADIHDAALTPSASLELEHSPARDMVIDASISHLYDPVTTHQMKSTARDATAHTIDPITSNNASLRATYKNRDWRLRASGHAKDIRLSLYQEDARMHGAIIRASAQRTITYENGRSLVVGIDATRRWMHQTTGGREQEQVPGPAPLQASLRAAYAGQDLGLRLTLQTHSNRTQLLSREHTATLGPLYLLSIGASTKLGLVRIGAGITNVLGSLHENKIRAYRKYPDLSKEIDYVNAPALLPRISANLKF